MADQPELKVTAEDDGGVRVRVDRPGVSAVSVVEDPAEVIRQVCAAAGWPIDVESTPTGDVWTLTVP